MRFKRIFLIVLDSLGVGEALDSANYGDGGANTLGHIKENYDLFIPNLAKIGFLNTLNMDENTLVDAYYTIARPNNAGKDTLAGHYEMMGITSNIPFKTFNENGFPIELIDEIATRYRIDGFNIDYVRYPNVSKENFNNQWGYTKYAREEFKQIYGVDPVEISKKDSLWDEWCQYRSDKITDYVIRVSKYLKYRKIMFSAVVFPDYKTSLQTKYQDWTNWTDKKYTDAITPLILTSDDELAYNMLEEIKKKAGEVTVYPGLFAGFIEADPEDLLRQIHIIRKLKLNGVILFDWAHLNSDYLEVLKTSVFKSQNF